MIMDMDIVRMYAENALKSILKDINTEFTSEVGSNGALTIKLNSSIDICGYNALPQFMFMKDGEVYFFTLFDEIELTVENAALAFECSTSTALNIALDDYLTPQLGAYLFDERNAGEMIARYFDDLIYLIDEDEHFKELLNNMH